MNRLSYSRNTDSYSYIYESMASMVRHWANLQPDKPALVVYLTPEERTAITFGELYQKAETVAKYFVSVGVKRADKVAVFVQNSLEWLISTVACFLTGAIAVNSFTFSADSDFRAVRDLGCKVLVVDVRDAHGDLSISHNLANFISDESSQVPVVVVDNKEETFKFQSIPNLASIKRFADLLQNPVPSDSTIPLPEYLDPEDVATVFKTSGSTGVPKFVTCTHVGLMNNSSFYLNKMQVQRKDIYFSDRPMGYLAGFPAAAIALGCTFVTLKTRSTVRDSHAPFVCQILRAECVTAAFLPSYLVYDMEQRTTSPSVDVPLLNSVITSGQRISKSLLTRFKTYSSRPCLGYGSTEVGWSHCAAMDELPDVDEALIGIPLPTFECKIIDEQGNIAPPGAEGEICLRGDTFNSSYLFIDGSSVKVSDEKGWFHSGDIGFMLEDGKNFCIIGRKVEIIKRALLKIFPTSIETKLSKHPAIEEVVVVGIPDDRLYQEICACVTVKPEKSLTCAELQAFALDLFKPANAPDGRGHMPGFFQIWKNFPRLPSQKINRREVAAMAVEMSKAQT